jgi:hypothetical protein
MTPLSEGARPAVAQKRAIFRDPRVVWQGWLLHKSCITRSFSAVWAYLRSVRSIRGGLPVRHALHDRRGVMKSSFLPFSGLFLVCLMCGFYWCGLGLSVCEYGEIVSGIIGIIGIDIGISITFWAPYYACPLRSLWRIQIAEPNYIVPLVRPVVRFLEPYLEGSVRRQTASIYRLSLTLGSIIPFF